MGQPRPLFHLFLSFQTHITNFTTNRYVKKCPSSIRCWDSNSRPLEHESPLITTRPGFSAHPLVLLRSALNSYFGKTISAKERERERERVEAATNERLSSNWKQIMGWQVHEKYFWLLKIANSGIQRQNQWFTILNVSTEYYIGDHTNIWPIDGSTFLGVLVRGGY